MPQLLFINLIEGVRCVLFSQLTIASGQELNFSALSFNKKWRFDKTISRIER